MSAKLQPNCKCNSRLPEIPTAPISLPIIAAAAKRQIVISRCLTALSAAFDFRKTLELQVYLCYYRCIQKALVVPVSYQ